MVITNPNAECNFNALVDIDTDIPLLVVPIKCSFSNRILGAFEVINPKGIEGLSTLGRAKLTTRDYDIAEYFSIQLAQLIINVNKQNRNLKKQTTISDEDNVNISIDSQISASLSENDESHSKSDQYKDHVLDNGNELILPNIANPKKMLSRSLAVK